MFSSYHEKRDDDPVLDVLMQFLNCLPEYKLKMIDFDRYRLLMKTAAELKHILAETAPQGKLEIDLCDLFNNGSIQAESDDLTVSNPRRFAAMIAGADNFEIYPQTNGKLRLNITFHAVMKMIE